MVSTVIIFVHKLFIGVGVCVVGVFFPVLLVGVSVCDFVSPLSKPVRSVRAS